jgi:hypothetical protein
VNGIVVLVHTAAVWFMAGSIWTMQILNYPLLDRVGRDALAGYETAHNRRFVAVVGPGAGLALLTTVVLLVARPAGVGVALPITSAALQVVVLGVTARYQAPAHARLATGFDAATHVTLVRTNWVRTAAWSLAGVLALLMLAAG